MMRLESLAGLILNFLLAWKDEHLETIANVRTYFHVQAQQCFWIYVLKL